MSKEVARAIASQCLVYPEQAFLDRYDELVELASNLEPKLRNPLLTFLKTASDMPLNKLQEHYVEIFDMRRKCSLFLTSWTHGDTRNRGRLHRDSGGRERWACLQCAQSGSV